MTSPSEKSPGPPSVDAFAAARDHLAVSPSLAIPTPNPSARLPDPFAAARNYARVDSSSSSAGPPPSPYLDPFATARNFPHPQVTIPAVLGPADVALQNYLRAQSRSGNSSHPLPATLKAERREVDRPGEEAPPAKKAKVNNTIVRARFMWLVHRD